MCLSTCKLSSNFKLSETLLLNWQNPVILWRHQKCSFRFVFLIYGVIFHVYIYRFRFYIIHTMNLFKVNICDCQLKWQLNSNSMTFNVICNQKGRARFSREKKHEFHWNYTLCVYGPVLKVLIIMVIVLLKHLEMIDVNRIELPINRCINTVVSCFFHFFSFFQNSLINSVQLIW